jgi:hypothetical protein
MVSDRPPTRHSAPGERGSCAQIQAEASSLALAQLRARLRARPSTADPAAVAVAAAAFDIDAEVDALGRSDEDVKGEPSQRRAAP